jgi:hypothetical protein
MPPHRSHLGFAVANLAVWVGMVVILVLVPDTLEPWTGLTVARVIGWAVAGVVWVVSVESSWKTRVGPIGRFVVQTLLWVSAALLAVWISEQARVG